MATVDQIEQLEHHENAGLINIVMEHPITKEWVRVSDEQLRERRQTRRTDLEVSLSLTEDTGVYCMVGHCAHRVGNNWPRRLVPKTQMICLNCQISAFPTYLTGRGC